MNFELGEEEKAFIAVINDLCKKEIPGKHIDKVKYLDELDIEEARRQGNLREILRERLPWDFLKKAHDVGIRTLTVPAKYGGGGIGLFTEMVVSEALGRWGGVAVLSSEPYAFCNCMRTFASEELQDEIFPQIMENYTLLTSTAITEPDAGTDTHIPYDEPGAGMKTFAYAEGDEYVINGEKAFCTGGGQADFITLFARTDKNAPISKGMSAFLVPTKSPGVSVVRVNDMIMNELRRNTDLLFENVRIPKRYLIGKENEGYALWEAFRVLVIRFAGAEVGAFQKMYELTKEYATTRIQGGKPIIEHVNIGSRILDIGIS